jgi:nucleotide-binding universal stress UspA family protein
LVLLHVSVATPLFREGPASAREIQRFFEEQREWARKALEERAAEARGQGISTLVRVVTGVPHEEIVATAQREGIGLIIMGTHGRGGLGRFLLGSVADRVIRTAPCAVVTRRATNEGGAQ